jgi:hypothetical protein
MDEGTLKLPLDPVCYVAVSLYFKLDGTLKVVKVFSFSSNTLNE